MGENTRRVGLAGAGRPGLDSEKAAEGVEVTIPAGYLKGLRLRVRAAGSQNPHHEQFMADWGKGKFREAVEKAAAGESGPDKDALMQDGLKATSTPEYVAHVLLADLPDGVAIPDEVESLDDLPEDIHDHYTKDGARWRRKKNRKDWTAYTPEIGVWLLGQQRYAALLEWTWRLAAREDQFLEEQVQREGNT